MSLYWAYATRARTDPSQIGFVAAMLGLFLPPSGPVQWIDVPRRTFMPEHDPSRGRRAIRDQLLGIGPDRLDQVVSIKPGVTVLHRADLRDLQSNESARSLLGRDLLGPVVILATDDMYTSASQEELVDLDRKNLAWTSSIKADNTAAHPRLIADPQSGMRTLLHVRSIVATKADKAFDEVLSVVNEFVEASQCTLTNVQTGYLPLSTSEITFYYTAIADPADAILATENSPLHDHTHTGRITHNG